MTIPEEMMAVIQETAKKAAREGAKEVIAEQTRKAAGRCDRRLRNTKLLLKNYRMFKKHCTGLALIISKFEEFFRKSRILKM